MAAPAGFEFEVRGSEVVIFHHGKKATVLRGQRAREFLEVVGDGDPQLLMGGGGDRQLQSRFSDPGMFAQSPEGEF